MTELQAWIVIGLMLLGALGTGLRAWIAWCEYTRKF